MSYYERKTQISQKPQLEKTQRSTRERKMLEEHRRLSNDKNGVNRVKAGTKAVVNNNNPPIKPLIASIVSLAKMGTNLPQKNAAHWADCIRKYTPLGDRREPKI